MQSLTEGIREIENKLEVSWMTCAIQSNEEKEKFLCRHAKKLAIVNTSPGTTIKTTKIYEFVRIVILPLNSYLKYVNVRSLFDICHGVIKDGKCSCGGYWRFNRYIHLIIKLAYSLF